MGEHRVTKRRRVGSPSRRCSSVSPVANDGKSPNPDPACPVHNRNSKNDTVRGAEPIPIATRWFRRPSIVWYRGHDLRVEDHPALLAAAQRGGPVVPLFICEEGTINSKGEPKRWWLLESLRSLRNELRNLGVDLYLRKGTPRDELIRFIQETDADAVFWNRAYEPEFLTRDEQLREELAAMGMTAESFKAELLIEPWELADGGTSGGEAKESNPSALENENSGVKGAPFSVFHDYMHAWMALPPPPQPFPSPSSLQPVRRKVDSESLGDLGINVVPSRAEHMARLWTPGAAQANRLLEKFLHEVFPAFGEEKCRKDFHGTSRLSPYLCFGELSPRRLYHATRVRVSSWERHHPHDPHEHHQQRALWRARKTSGHKKELYDESINAKSTAGASSKAGDKSGQCTTDIRDRGSVSERLKQNKVKSKVADVGEVRPATQGLRTIATSSVSNEDSQSAVNGKPPRSLTRRRLGKKKRSLGKPLILQSAKAFLKNLCLRDFAYHVSYHFPDFYSKPLIKEFTMFPWAPDEGAFERWKTGTTGYPLVDAAMRQLRITGWIHNKMRFLLASFLTKYLLLPWQRGLKEFYTLLLDGDQSANALGWQWTSGCNTDAFPFNVLVNPAKLGGRLDPSGAYVRQWVPELAKLPADVIHQPWRASRDMLNRAGIILGKEYPRRVVEGSNARKRARDAMHRMRQIFLAAKPAPYINEMLREEDVFREWPDDEDGMTADDLGSSEDRVGLLPSLWSLSQYDVPPGNFTHAASSIEEMEQDIGLEDGSLESNTPMPMLVTSLEMPLGAPVLSGSSGGSHLSHVPYFQQQIVVSQQVSGGQLSPSAHFPNVHNQNVFLPGLQLTNVQIPNIQVTGTQVPSMHIPGVQMPNVQPGVPMAPSLPSSNAQMDNVQIPGVPMTNLQAQTLHGPNMQLVMTPAEQSQQASRYIQEGSDVSLLLDQTLKLSSTYEGDILTAQQSQPHENLVAASGSSLAAEYVMDANAKHLRQGHEQLMNEESQGKISKPEKPLIRSLNPVPEQDTSLRKAGQPLNAASVFGDSSKVALESSGAELGLEFGNGVVVSSQPRSPAPKRDTKRTRGSTVGRYPSGSRARRGSDNSRSVRSRNKSVRAPEYSGEATGYTSETRRRILENVIKEKDNVYHNLAKYLASTYDFTSNTNRETSKDYVRLCNLKDDYHKHCMDEKDKLKIYKIKSFFSDVLKLQVTGEWDRHNHGGVRGPYVYGIRASAQNNSDGKAQNPKSQHLGENHSRQRKGHRQSKRKATVSLGL